MPRTKHVLIVGAGPGGLTSAMILARRGFKVTVLEKREQVGGGTHPGSGLPTIYESGRISADMLCKSYGMKVDPPLPLPT